jgi:hypothetical protein
MASARVKRLFHARRIILRAPDLILFDVAVLVFVLVITLSLQWASGAHSSAFGAEPDEASHYVTGVMVRDYIARGLPGNPITFAKDFYLHYPRVAFGLWPPLFHLWSGVWMLAFGTGRMSVMFMLALLTTTWAFIFYRLARRVCGRIGALLSVLVLVSLPATQQSASSVMVDLPLAVMMLAAMGAYAHYLESEKAAAALRFGLCAALALLIKYNALALALLPPICVVITGRYYLLRTKNFWLPAAVVLVVAGPWYVVMRHLVVYAAEPGGNWPPLGHSLVADAKGIILVAGPIVFFLAVVGSILVVRGNRKARQAINKPWPLYATAVSFVLAVFLFASIYPVYEFRYLLPATPALILLAQPAIEYLLSFLGKRRAAIVAAWALIAAAHVASTFVVQAKNNRAYVRVADEILGRGLPDGGGVLVSADAKGEGMLTAEFVMRDQRPNHYVVRASKVLATQTLMGDKYQLRYQSPEGIMTALDSIPIAVVVMRQCPSEQCSGHENLLAQTAGSFPERWQLAASIPNETGPSILVYRIVGNETKAVRTLQIDMSPTLGTTVEKR